MIKNMRFFSVCISFLLISSLLASCGKEDNNSSATANVQLSVIHNAVKSAYGDNYIPSLAYNDTEISEKFGISPDMYDEAVAEGPMMSTHVDTFIAVKAKEGKADAVKQKLDAYRTSLIDESMQYPMNTAKIQASRVEQFGNYVFFVMLGEYAPMDIEEQGDEALLNYYKQQTELGVNAIKKSLGAA